jgi:hypothetical protein
MTKISTHIYRYCVRMSETINFDPYLWALIFVNFYYLDYVVY